jgi:hypothetical protein
VQLREELPLSYQELYLIAALQEEMYTLATFHQEEPFALSMVLLMEPSDQRSHAPRKRRIVHGSML